MKSVKMQVRIIPSVMVIGMTCLRVGGQFVPQLDFQSVAGFDPKRWANKFPVVASEMHGVRTDVAVRAINHKLEC